MIGRRSWQMICLLLLLVLSNSRAVLAQPTGPQPWWPTQPTPLPFLHPLFANDMVLQRDISAPIWGWAKPGDKIIVQVNGQPAGHAAVVGSDGRWTTKIGPFVAGGPHEITVEGGGRTAKLTNVLFGDVWLCTGQSNMNWPVRLSDSADEEVNQANDAEIRSFTVNFYSSLVPLKLPPPAKWEVCTPEFARNFTGVGYFFARQIRATQKVPIGIIHSSAVATAAEAWVSGEALRREMPFDFPARFAELDKLIEVGRPNFDYFSELEKWTATVDPISAEKKYISDPRLNTDDWLDIAVPKPWEEAGLEPLKDFDGLVWFRHEIDIPETWAGQDLSLVLSVINDVDIVWLNGTLIGSTQLPGIRRYLVNHGQVRPGKNVLVAAVLNHKGPGGFCSAPTNMALYPAINPGDRRVKLAGTWKAKPAVAIAD